MDESQLEVTKDLVQLKTFSEEEDAKVWKKSHEASTGKILSNVGHVGDNFYVAYTKGGELACRAMKEAGEYYNLNITLSAGYDLGRNWAECH